MSEWIIPPEGIIEPSPAPEIYIDDAGAIELVGNDIRIYCYVQQLPLEIAGGSQKVCVLKVRRPIVTIPATICRLARCIDTNRHPSFYPGGPFKPHVVK